MNKENKIIIAILIMCIIGFSIGWITYGRYYSSKTSLLSASIVSQDDNNLLVSYSRAGEIKRDTFIINDDSIINTELDIDKRVDIIYYVKNNVIKELN